MEGERVTPLYLVKLVSDEYSVPQGSIGYISLTRDRLSDNAYTVHWTESPGPGGASSPVISDALAMLGRIWVPLEIVEARTPQRKLEDAVRIIRSELLAALTMTDKLIEKEEE